MANDMDQGRTSPERYSGSMTEKNPTRIMVWKERMEECATLAYPAIDTEKRLTTLRSLLVCNAKPPAAVFITQEITKEGSWSEAYNELERFEGDREKCKGLDTLLDGIEQK
jgi:hypothetical protein